MTREEQIKLVAENNLDVSMYTLQDGEILKESFYIGAEWADRFPKSPWISVKNDLPCNHKELIETIGTITGVPTLIATQNRVILGIRIKSKDDKWYWCDNSTTLSPMIEEIMFWMPIPKLPKE